MVTYQVVLNFPAVEKLSRGQMYMVHNISMQKRLKNDVLITNYYRQTTLNVMHPMLVVRY